MTSCGDNSTKESDANAADTLEVSEISQDTTAIDPLVEFKFQMTIGNIPYPPADLYNLVEKLPNQFNEKLVNPADNVGRYLSNFQKGINYGVYSVDLLYLAANNRLGQSRAYFTVVRSLSRQLDMLEVFGKIVSKRIEESSENKDSIIKIYNEVFGATDEYLRSGKRMDAATQILIGCWVESQYIITNTLKGQAIDANTKPILDRVYEQKLHLANICNLLEEYKTDKEFSVVIADLNKLNKTFSNLKSTEDVPASLENISKEVSAIRTKIVGS